MNKEILLTLIGASVIMLLLVLFLVLFAFLFKKRQFKNQQEKTTLQAQFSQEILKSQIEVQNSTLQQIGEELHDNIGQLLSVAKINLNILEVTNKDLESQEYIQQTNEIIGQSIQDLRSLTKSLDGDFVQQFGLQESMTHELQRIRKTKKFETEITLTGDPYTLGYEREIILFRIFQEFLNNSLKHSEAKNIIVKLNYSLLYFNLALSDDGKGFDQTKITTHKLLNSGAGLRNMSRRCELIGAKCNLESSIGQGTFLNIELPIKNSVNS